jgi:hypothetical protein
MYEVLPLVTKGLCDQLHNKSDQTTEAHLIRMLVMIHVWNYSFFELGPPKVVLIFITF